MKNILLLTLGLISCLSCKSGFKFRLDAQQYARKQSFKYYKERNWQSASGLRTDGIYYTVFQDTSIVFYRFAEDGYLIYNASERNWGLENIISYQKQISIEYPAPVMGYFKVHNDSLFFSEKDIGKKEWFAAGVIFKDSLVIYPANKKQEIANDGAITYRFVPFELP